MEDAKDISSTLKVLVADDDVATSRQLCDFLTEKGFMTEHVRVGGELKEKVKAIQPTFILCDLTLVELNAIGLLQWLRSDEADGYDPKVFVLSSHAIARNIRECIRLGAKDFIAKPFTFEDVLNRLVFHVQRKRDTNLLKDVDASQLEGGDVYVNLLEMVLGEAMSGRSSHEILYQMVKIIAVNLQAVRCNVIKVHEDFQSGEVAAASDDPELQGLKINLGRYPEVTDVIHSGNTVVIEDVDSDPHMQAIKDTIQGLSFNSMIVVPVMKDGNPWGVISARMDKEHSTFTERDIRFVQMVGQIASIFLSGKSIIPHEWLISNESQEDSSDTTEPAKEAPAA